MLQQVTIGDIFRQYGQEYILENKVQGQEKGLVYLLSACRTQALGSHFMQCSHCGHVEKSYNSCRNRHCPVCQQKDKEKWLAKRMEELLSVGYYHMVFTLPHQLNRLWWQNKKVMGELLFKAASQTILELAKDTRHLGADTGLVTVLHTWGQCMIEHPHLHCIMPAGGLSFDRAHWVHADKKKDFFVHYKVLSRNFRGKFLHMLQKANESNQLLFKGDISYLSVGKSFMNFTWKLKKMEWVVNIQRPLGNPSNILGYLSKYVFRVAISNNRVIGVDGNKVKFWWKDNRTGLYRKMKLDIREFIRRFLLHVLPEGFFKVRYYGIFSSRYRKQNIELSKRLLEEQQNLETEQGIEDKGRAWIKQKTVFDEILQMVLAYAPPNCPRCKKGRMAFAGVVPFGAPPG